jgi:hypothetical protein
MPTKLWCWHEAQTARTWFSPLFFLKGIGSADQERETLPLTGDEKGALSIARRRKR